MDGRPARTHRSRSGRRIFVATPAWEKLLPRIMSRRVRIAWLPMPSNIPVVKDRARIAAVRRNFVPAERLLVGHFGTFGRNIAGLLDKILPRLLNEVPAADAILIGHNSEQCKTALARERPDLARRIHASGSLPSCEVSTRIS